MKKVTFILFIMVLSLLTVYAGSDNPSGNIEIRWDGLQVISFARPGLAVDGILNVPHHTPKIEILEIRNGVKKSIKTFNAVEFEGQELHITTSNNQPITQFHSQGKDNDFNWVLDLESDLFQRKLYVKKDALFAKVTINTGQFFARNLTEERVIFRSGSKQLPFNRRIGEPAAKLNLNPGEILKIESQKISYQLQPEPGVSYLVEITNLPPAEMASIDHFAFYYDAISTTVEPFMPVMVKKASLSPRPLLCASVILSKSEF